MLLSITIELLQLLHANCFGWLTRMISSKSIPAQAVTHQPKADESVKSTVDRQDAAFELLLGLIAERSRPEKLPPPESLQSEDEGGKSLSSLDSLTASIAAQGLTPPLATPIVSTTPASLALIGMQFGQFHTVSSPTGSLPLTQSGATQSLVHPMAMNEVAKGVVSALMDSSIAALKQQSGDPVAGAELGLDAAKRALAVLNAQADQNVLAARLAAAARGDKQALEALIADGLLSGHSASADQKDSGASGIGLQLSIQSALSGWSKDSAAVGAPDSGHSQSETALLSLTAGDTQRLEEVPDRFELGSEFGLAVDTQNDEVGGAFIAQRAEALSLSSVISHSQLEIKGGSVGSPRVQTMLEPTVTWLLSRQGGGATIDLSPPDLGHLRVELKLDAAGQQATLVVHPSSEAAKASVEQSLSKLIDVFSAAGMQLSVSVGGGQSGFEFARERDPSSAERMLSQLSAHPLAANPVSPTALRGVADSGLSLYV